MIAGRRSLLLAALGLAWSTTVIAPIGESRAGGICAEVSAELRNLVCANTDRLMDILEDLAGLGGQGDQSALAMLKLVNELEAHPSSFDLEEYIELSQIHLSPDRQLVSAVRIGVQQFDSNQSDLHEDLRLIENAELTDDLGSAYTDLLSLLANDQSSRNVMRSVLIVLAIKETPLRTWCVSTSGTVGEPVGSDDLTGQALNVDEVIRCGR